MRASRRSSSEAPSELERSFRNRIKPSAITACSSNLRFADRSKVEKARPGRSPSRWKFVFKETLRSLEFSSIGGGAIQGWVGEGSTKDEVCTSWQNAVPGCQEKVRQRHNRKYLGYMFGSLVGMKRDSNKGEIFGLDICSFFGR